MREYKHRLAKKRAEDEKDWVLGAMLESPEEETMATMKALFIRAVNARDDDGALKLLSYALNLSQDKHLAQFCDRHGGIEYYSPNMAGAFEAAGMNEAVVAQEFWSAIPKFREVWAGPTLHNRRLTRVVALPKTQEHILKLLAERFRTCKEQDEANVIITFIYDAACSATGMDTVAETALRMGEMTAERASKSYLHLARADKYVWETRHRLINVLAHARVRRVKPLDMANEIDLALILTDASEDVISRVKEFAANAVALDQK